MLKVLTVICMLFAVSSDLFAYKEIVVDLSEQRAYAIEDGVIIFDGPISTGVRGRETPEGQYTILQKKRYHKSNLWPKPNGGAKMNYMLRLTNSGIAMHLGYVPKKGPASHGCIRMKNGFAQRMYAWAGVGTSVYVEGDIEDWYAMHQRQRRQRNYAYDNDYFVVEGY
ncbi:L,D-transpeptidase family protein [Sulfurovum sp.]|nr:L,D-transpeptidase family protein [Sulfurovum sp.]